MFVRERAFVFRTQQCRTHIATHTHTLSHTQLARTTTFRNHDNPNKNAKIAANYWGCSHSNGVRSRTRIVFTCKHASGRLYKPSVRKPWLTVYRARPSFRKMSKPVDFAHGIRPNVCSFATEHSCSAHNSVAHT